MCAKAFDYGRAAKVKGKPRHANPHCLDRGQLSAEACRLLHKLNGSWDAGWCFEAANDNRRDK
jgi:hypothetical protein